LIENLKAEASSLLERNWDYVEALALTLFSRGKIPRWHCWEVPDELRPFSSETLNSLREDDYPEIYRRLAE
jgi:hypothetical protein